MKKKTKLVITPTPNGNCFIIEKLIEEMEYKRKTRKTKFIR